MRGSNLHNHILLDAVEEHLASGGWTTRREHLVALPDGMGAIDLLAERGGERLAIEVELTPDRVLRDVQKAIAIQAVELLIVTPNAAVRKAVRRRLRRHRRGGGREWLPTFALTQPQTLQHLASSFPFFAASILPGEQPSNPLHRKAPS